MGPGLAEKKNVSSIHFLGFFKLFKAQKQQERHEKHGMASVKTEKRQCLKHDDVEDKYVEMVSKGEKDTYPYPP